MSNIIEKEILKRTPVFRSNEITRLMAGYIDFLDISFALIGSVWKQYTVRDKVDHTVIGLDISWPYESTLVS